MTEQQLAKCAGAAKHARTARETLSDLGHLGGEPIPHRLLAAAEYLQDALCALADAEEEVGGFEIVEGGGDA